MAVTATFAQATSGRNRSGRRVTVTGVLSLSGTYDAGGFAITPGLFGLGRIDSLYPGVASNGTVALATRWDAANVKIKLFETAATVDLAFDEFDAGNSVTSFTLDVKVEGAG